MLRLSNPPPYQSIANFPAPETRCTEHYSQLLGLVTYVSIVSRSRSCTEIIMSKYKPTLAKHNPDVASSVASRTIDFADAMEKSLQSAQCGLSTLRLALASVDMSSFRQFTKVNPHPKTLTQGTWTKAWYDIKTVSEL